MAAAQKTEVNQGAEPEYSANYGVFNAFARALAKDFVGLPEGRRAPAFQGYLEDYAQKVWNGAGHTIQFVQQLETYLRAFGVPGLRLEVDHAATPYYPAFTWDMRVRAFDDELYVTDAGPASAFAPGDVITHASLYAEPSFAGVAGLRRRFGAALGGDTPDRELWDPLLHFANRYLVAADSAPDAEKPRRAAAQDAPGAPASALPAELHLHVADPARSRRVEPARVPLASVAVPEPFELSIWDDGTVLVTLRDLADEHALASWVEGNRATLDGATRLLIDARRCSGGFETALLPLLPYVADAPTALASFMETTCLTRYSTNNVERNLELLDSLCVECPDAREWADAVRVELAPKSGAGLVEEAIEIPEACRAEVAPRGRAARACLLTDVFTRDAAELLAEVCRASGRTTTVGRATRGGRGFFNDVAFTSGAYTLVYPMSRYTDDGLARHRFGCGVPPETVVPWTPAFLERDLDLAAAREALA